MFEQNFVHVAPLLGIDGCLLLFWYLCIHQAISAAEISEVGIEWKWRWTGLFWAIAIKSINRELETTEINICNVKSKK